LRPWIKGSGTTYPEEVLKVRVGSDGGNVEAVGPSQPLSVWATIRITPAANLLQGLGRRAGEASFPDQIPPHVADQVDVTDQDRAFLDARLAHGAGPESLIRDRLMDVSSA
jgi:hypothetical protein